MSFLLGYYLAIKGTKEVHEGFASRGYCNTCKKPKKKCACKCNTCQMPKPTCKCPCNVCDKPRSDCGCKPRRKTCPDFDEIVSPAPCPVPDPTKYVLRSTIPPCPGIPDMSRYMLKTECPSQPDMSKYVLKSTVPKCPPCISTCSKPCKIGECPPCPRPRCPVPNCPEPKPCPACPAVQVAACPEPKVQCKAAYEPNTKVRPMLASTSQFGL